MNSIKRDFKAFKKSLTIVGLLITRIKNRIYLFYIKIFAFLFDKTITIYNNYNYIFLFNIQFRSN